MWFFSSRKARPSTPNRPRRPYRPRLEALEDRRLLSAGALDPTFGNGGIATVPDMYSARDVAVQGDGKVVSIGWTNNTTGRLFEIVRTNANGSLDTSFGNGGVVTTGFQKYPDYGEALALQGN